MRAGWWCTTTQPEDQEPIELGLNNETEPREKERAYYVASGTRNGAQTNWTHAEVLVVKIPSP